MSKGPRSSSLRGDSREGVFGALMWSTFSCTGVGDVSAEEDVRGGFRP